MGSLEFQNAEFLPAARYEHAGLQVNFVSSSSSGKKVFSGIIRKVSNGAYVIKVPELISEVRSDLRGHWQPQRLFFNKHP